MARRNQSPFIAVKCVGGLLPPDVLQKIADGRDLDGLKPTDYHLAKNESVKDAITRAYSRLSGLWELFAKARDAQPRDEALTGLTRDKWLLPLFQELGFGRLPAAKTSTLEGKDFPVSHFYDHSPVHLIGCGLSLDERTKGAVGAARVTPHGMIQDFLNRSDEHLWGFVSNGLVLRVLRDNLSLTRQAYLEFDLETIMDGELFSEFALLWLVCHQSRVEGTPPENCWLERWTKSAIDQGVRARDHLRDGVQRAIETLGAGFLAHPRNDALRQRLRDGTLDRGDYYRQLLRVVYRLMFLFVAEDRDLLHPRDAVPEARDRYARYYSTARLRELARLRRGTRHADLWRLCRLVAGFLEEKGSPGLALPALGGFLWSKTATPDLDLSDIANRDLLQAIRDLSNIQDQETLRAIDYRNLGAEELGSVYESLLELKPTLDVTARSFRLDVVGGNERKTTGSYYTPTSLINCLLDSALDPVVEETVRGKSKDDAEKAILDLKVCDPACGSGHFLIGAAHRLAKRLASVRSGDDEPAPEAYQHALRDVIGRCIYGVDINPMAVELGKVSLWMESMEPGRPLSFLDHHLKRGNALLGTTPALMARGIPDEAFEPLTGDDKTVCRDLKKINRSERKDAEYQGDLFMAADSLAHGASMVRDAQRVAAMSDGTLDDVKAKTRSYHELVSSYAYKAATLAADAWCTAFVQDRSGEFRAPITDGLFDQIVADEKNCPLETRAEISKRAAEFHFFHWHLAFPEVFRPKAKKDICENEVTGWHGGFDVILGNPPWDLLSSEDGERAGAHFSRLQYLCKTAQYSVLNGRRDLYKLFLVTATLLPKERGRLGFLVPLGVFVEDDASKWRSWLFDNGSVLSLRHFQNAKKKFFPRVDSRYRFCAITFSPMPELPHRFSVVSRSPGELTSQSFVSVDRSDFDLVLGRNRAATIYPSQAYAVAHQVLLQALASGTRHSYSVVAEFHASSDKQVIRGRPSDDGWAVLKNRNVHFYSHEYAAHEEWVGKNDVSERLKSRGLLGSAWLERWPRLVFRDIARNDDERTFISCLVPPGCVSTYDTPMIVIDVAEGIYPDAIAALGAFTGSYLFDFLLRPYVDKHVKGYTLQRVPFPAILEQLRASEHCDFVLRRVAELSCTDQRFLGFAEDLGAPMCVFPRIETRRRTMRNELDAAFLVHFGVDRSTVELIMDSFSVVENADIAYFGDFRTKLEILEVYDAMQTAIDTGQPYRSPLDPPPADPSLCHPGSSKPGWL